MLSTKGDSIILETLQRYAWFVTAEEISLGLREYLCGGHQQSVVVAPACCGRWSFKEPFDNFPNICSPRLLEEVIDQRILIFVFNIYFLRFRRPIK